MSKRKDNSTADINDNESAELESVGENSAEAETLAFTEQASEQTSPDEPATLVVEQLQQKLQDAENRVIRGQAELDNIRKRMRREMEDRLKFASEALMKDVLQVADNLQLAILSAEENSEGSGLLAGVQMVVDLLDSVLAKHDCQKIEAVGKPFDPNLHEAVQMQPNEEVPANHVSLEIRPGYTLHDRVIRPTQVFVSTGKSD